ncbi:nucleoporin NUP37 [Pyrenophora seminiperda CCB06]|uniref:Nucleoporin NUP37 n=1 Tax=Pyrenophora seminiperda CCB06 TaxID=1302712 RepID=A0A3M7M713_9PLEO|nr:nucleoporin NUP37 [Pyrenophora seminiperda CCB06]
MASMDMKPIVATKGKLTQLRYELPQRIYDSTVYPLRAPNGSTVVLYGHETGVGVLWRGGRPLKKTAPSPKQPAKPARVNGAHNDAIMIIDSDDDEPAKAAAQPPPQAEFEDEEEELDPDQPYASIVQHVSLSLGTQVLHIAVPQISVASTPWPADTIPPIFSTSMVCTVACADSTIRVITLPLGPPPHAVKDKPYSASSQFGEEVVKIQGHQSIPRGVTMTWTARGETTSNHAPEEDMDIDGTDTTLGRLNRRQSNCSRPQAHASEGFDLLVASHSAELGGLLKIFRFELSESGLKVSLPVTPYKMLTLRKPASRIAFNPAQFPKRRHSQLLVTDSTGTARIYDPFASPSRKRPTSGRPNETGAFVRTLRASFESVKNVNLMPPVLASRKAIIDAAWASDGKHIVALLADGEWGVWDVDRSGPSPPVDPSAFSLRGYVGTPEKEGSNSSGGPSSPKRSSRNTLAPMTPNTRRRKEEVLFQGNPAGSAAATRGGISVATLLTANGASSEDSVIIWYGSDVYRIADLAKFWTRTASATSGGSLPSPGLQAQDVALCGEVITSISQFGTTPQASRMAVARDTLISAEHRIIITASTSQPLGRDLSAMFTRERIEDESTSRVDQALLTRGELDLGGMDRMLESMEGSGTSAAVSMGLTMGGPRKVLFASSTA